MIEFILEKEEPKNQTEFCKLHERGLKERELLFYQIKIEIKQYKTDEFVKSMRSFARRIRKEKGCLGYSVYQDSNLENLVLPPGRKLGQVFDFE